jgi:hypothetical protein
MRISCTSAAIWSAQICRRFFSDAEGGLREELASGLSDVLFMQQISGKRIAGHKKSPFSFRDCL